MTSLTGKVSSHYRTSQGNVRRTSGYWVSVPKKRKDLSNKKQKCFQVLADISVQNRGVDESLARPGKKQARKHIRDARDLNNIETRAVIKFFFPLQGKAPKEIQAILTETLSCFLSSRTKDLSAPL